MSSLIIRDDDLSYWTRPTEIEKVYKPIFDKKVKVSFATIPFSVKMYNAGNFNTFYQALEEKPIGENKEIINYIKEKIKENLVEIMLHGYNHLYSFECDGKIDFAIKENLEKSRRIHKKIKFLGEYNYQDYKTLNKKTRLGKEYLEDLFKVKIKNFVPPSNQINKSGIKAIIDNNLNLSGLIGKRYNREFTFRGILTYLDRVLWNFRYKNIIYPKIANYGKHKELTGYALTPSTNWDRYYKQLNFCIKNNYPFQIATHYWELKGELKERFYKVIDYALKNGMESKFLKEVWK